MGALDSSSNATESISSHNGEKNQIGLVPFADSAWDRPITASIEDESTDDAETDMWTEIAIREARGMAGVLVSLPPGIEE